MQGRYVPLFFIGARYQYSNLAPRLSGQTSTFGVVSFASKSRLGIERQKKQKKNYNFDPKTFKPERILIY